MSIKKYTSGSWVTVPYRKYEAATDTITTLPKQIIADGQSATANIIGNMNQQGTPSPSSIIMPTETGDKTANLYNDATTEQGYRIQWTTGNAYADATALMSDYILVDTGTYSTDAGYLIVGYDTNKSYVGVYRGDTVTWEMRSSAQVSSFTVNANSGVKYVRLLAYGDYYPLSNTTMVNAGSTALPLEPYGFQIPILSGDTTTNVYLGEVQTTRKIKKLVLTGQETGWDRQTPQHTNVINLYCPIANAMGNSPIYSNIATYFSDAGINNDSRVNVGKVNIAGTNLLLDLSLSDFTSTNAFKTYLQQQYANGTPVCVWYILATPTTITLNEPIRKIGSYSDSVSVTGIPTTGTAEQFDVDTTLKPSEVDLTYHGWHEHSDTKF